MASHDLTQLQMLPAEDSTGELTPTRLQHALLALQEDASELRAIPRTQRVQAIAQTCESLLDPNSHRMARLITECADEFHWSEAMIAFIIRDLLRLLSAPGISALLQDELGVDTQENAFVTDALRATQRMLVPPASTLHILAATVPTTPIEAIALSLAAGVPCMVRTSRENRVCARFFLKALRETAPALAKHAAVVTWNHDDPAYAEAIRAARPTVIVHGSDQTIAKIRGELQESTDVIGQGHRYSFALVAPDDTLTKGQIQRLAEAIALDAALFEGGGCMSPQSIFVLPPAAQEDLDELLAQAIAEHGFPSVQKTLPRGAVPADVAAEQMQQIGVADFTGKSWRTDAGTALLSATAELHASPGWRHVHVVKVRAIDELIEQLEPWRESLSTAGLSCGETARLPIAKALANAGVRRICPVGRMQRPVLLRAHDGLPRVRAWFHTCDIEG